MFYLHLKCLFAPAATTGDEQVAGHDVPADGLEEPPSQVPLQELKRRAGIKFSGATGAAVASGDGGITTAPTYGGLVQDVITVVKELPTELFDAIAEHRPCGLLDKYDAMGMLICDVMGLPAAGRAAERWSMWQWFVATFAVVAGMPQRVAERASLHAVTLVP